MRTRQSGPANIDEYIAGFPGDIQKVLQRIRKTIGKAAPRAEETISYQIASFTLNGKYLIYFAGHKKHVGLYPAPRGSDEFKAELAEYEGGKGTLQFPYDKPVPFGLIGRIVKFRAKEILEREKAKANKRK